MALLFGNHPRRHGWLPCDLFQASPTPAACTRARHLVAATAENFTPNLMPGEFANRQNIAALQLGQLRQLLAAILPRNAFYQEKFAGIDPAIASLEDFSRRFPFTTKAELAADQRAFPPYGSNLTVPLEQYARFHQTSGTLSEPMRWLDTP